METFNAAYCTSPSLAPAIHSAELIRKFDDFVEVERTQSYICGVDLIIRKWHNRDVLGGLRLHYSDGQQFNYGEKTQIRIQTVRLQKNERITDVEGSSGWMVDNLTFHTNLGNNFGPFGGPGGSKRNVSPPQTRRAFPYLAAMSGDVVKSQGYLAIINLRFIYGSYGVQETNNYLMSTGPCR